MRTARTVRRGVAATELALILPVLVLIVLICVDFGRYAYTNIAVRNSARAGCGHGTMNRYPIGNESDAAAWQADVQNTARDEMKGQTGYTSDDLAIVANAESVDPATGLRMVEVTAIYGDGSTTGFKTIVSWPGIPDRPQLRSTIVACMIR